MPENNAAEPTPHAEPKKKGRGGRHLGQANFATLHSRAVQRLQFVRGLLEEARDSDNEATTKALVNVALRTLAEE